jgi:hypothetical protein
MGAANDFLNLFFKQYPEAAAGNLSMEELNGLMTEFQNKMNNSQLDDFDGDKPFSNVRFITRPILCKRCIAL